jgi:hypothetical protein
MPLRRSGIPKVCAGSDRTASKGTLRSGSLGAVPTRAVPAIPKAPSVAPGACSGQDSTSNRADWRDDWSADHNKRAELAAHRSGETGDPIPPGCPAS